MRRNLSPASDANNGPRTTCRIRRCALVFVELREAARVDLPAIFAGGSGLVLERCLHVLAPHLGASIEVDPDDVRFLASLSATEWIDRECAQADANQVDRMIACGLVLTEGDAASAERDELLRRARWFPPAALLHAQSRWQSIDSVKSMELDGLDRADTLRQRLGPPPNDPRVDLARQIALPRHDAQEFDLLLRRRATCRNFDGDRALGIGLVAKVLDRVFGHRGSITVAGDTTFIKKNVPSGGGLHPIEAIVLARQVDGLDRGAYRYLGDAHALVPVALRHVEDFEAYLLQAVAGQHWFAGAHVMVVLAPRFERTFWKYRNHAKAYRVVAMEAGHIAQTLYLAATDAGLGAFVTAAINEIDVDRSLDLDGITQGSIAICGFGWRADEMRVAEFDPAGAVWPQA